MAILPRVRFVISGTMIGGESFATGFDVAEAAGISTSELQGEVDALATWLDSGPALPLKGLIHPDTVITKVTGYSYAADATAAGASASHDINIPGTGGVRHPNQCALVLSLRTATAGRQHRGRMFWPATSGVVGPLGYLTNPSPQDVATAAALMLKAPNALAAPIVVSRAGNSTTDITAVRVDGRWDVQRGRAQRQAVGPVGVAAVT